MNVVLSQNPAYVGQPAVVAIGNFDGLHLGHQALLQTAKEIASKHNLPLLMLTFEPLPCEYFASGESPVRLQRLTEKWLIAQELGVDAVVALKFNSKLVSLSPEVFVRTILSDQLCAHTVVVGDDFRFGHAQKGDVRVLAELAQRYGFAMKACSLQQHNGLKIGSSQLRACLNRGDVALAQVLLGRPYSLTSRVIYGDQRGREWGFPTANMALLRQTPPLTGIFVVKVKGEDFVANGVASIGYRPVFALAKPLLEVHLLDFNRQIYGQRLCVEFLHKLRDEANFTSVDNLIEQIAVDVAQARDYLASLC
jgi:riboflavin kinase / FMN adenylyltransferase